MKKERIWLAAEGYLELEMEEEALTELGSLSSTVREEERSQELFLAGYMMASDWNNGANIAKKLCEIHPLRLNYFIHAAYCLHETGDTYAAKDWLIRGPKSLMKNALFHYNMGCYCAVLGEPYAALPYLKKAFELDSSLRKVAVTDRDLEEVDLDCLLD